MSFLSRLHDKPSHVKSQIAFVGAILVTGIIGVVWATTIPARLGALETNIAKTDGSQSASIGDSYNDFMNGVQNDGEETEGEGKEVPVAPSQTGGVPEESAFHGLADWRASTTTMSPSTTPQKNETAPPATEEPVPIVTSGTSTSGGVTGNTGVRTILIGTSTRSTTTKSTQ